MKRIFVMLVAVCACLGCGEINDGWNIKADAGTDVDAETDCPYVCVTPYDCYHGDGMVYPENSCAGDWICCDFGNTDTDSDTDTGTETDSETDTGSDTGDDAGTDTDSDTDTETSSDTDTDTGTSCVGSGVWYDAASDLCWENPPSIGYLWWASAGAYCSSLGTDWRLPTLDELRSIVVGCPQTELGGDPCTDGCDGCTWIPGSCYWPGALSGVCSSYWSSDTMMYEGTPSAWLVYYATAAVNHSAQECTQLVRCVREG